MPVGVLVDESPLTTETFDAVSEKVLADGDPEGLLVRAAGEKSGGGFRVFTVWESAEQYERFREERLIPAIREVAGEQAGSGPPAADVFELHDFFTKS
jgi:hypothetical protein